MTELVSRRSFFKACSLATLALFHSSNLDFYSRVNIKQNIQQASILYDSTKCRACGLCFFACKNKNNLPIDGNPSWINQSLSEKTWVTVNIVRSSSGFVSYLRRACMHCLDPPCLPVCPVKAIYKNEYGIVLTDYNKCFGCGYCVVACPYDARHIDKKGVVYRGVSVKCTMCEDRVKQGLEPACVAACPFNALEFGERNEIIRRARERVAYLRGRGIESYVFGDEEDIGNSVIYVLPVEPEKLGLPIREMRIPPPVALQELLIQRGGLAIFGAAALAFLSFILWRREMILRARIKEKSKT
ncbi:MAG: 4Fe-4S dicluster domain-containing protein [Candidatus Methanomethylicia archaeon]